MMKRDEIVSSLRYRQLGPGGIACLGCGWENSCGVRGCRIMREAADMLENDEAHSGVLQDAIEKWKKAYGTLREKHSALLEQNEELRDAAATVTRLAAEAAVERDWISVEDRLPEDDGDVLAIVSGYPTPNITLEDVMVVAAFCEEEGWYIGEYPDWDNPIITYWMPLPKPPKTNDRMA